VVSAEAREASFGLCSTVRECWFFVGAQDAAAAAVVGGVRPLTTALSEEAMERPGAHDVTRRRAGQFRTAEKEVMIVYGQMFARRSSPGR
jgi:hypothetical protein